MSTQNAESSYRYQTGRTDGPTVASRRRSGKKRFHVEWIALIQGTLARWLAPLTIYLDSAQGFSSSSQVALDVHAFLAEVKLMTSIDVSVVRLARCRLARLLGRCGRARRPREA